MKEGNEDIYREHARFVYGYLLKKCHDPHLAEDLMQDTFLIALQKLDTYDGSCKISTWLCGIANHLMQNEFRRRKSDELQEYMVKDEPDWDVAGTMKFVHALAEPYREVVYLRLAANLSFAQIGEILGKSENWTRVTFYLKTGRRPLPQ